MRNDTFSVLAAATQRPRLLCVLGKSPVPDNTGSRRRILRLIQAAHNDFEIHMLVVVSRPLPRDDADALENLELGTHRVLQVPGARSFKSRDQLGAGLPRSWRKVDLTLAKRMIADEVQRFDPGIVWVASPLLFAACVPDGIYDRKGRPIPVVIDVAHTEKRAIDSQLKSDFRNLIARPRNLRRMALLASDRAASIRTERRAFTMATMLTVCSAVEASIAIRHAAGDVIVVPNGIDLPPNTGRTAGGHGILFVGNFGYRPNAEAAEYLAKRILPQVRISHPDAQVRLVGPGAGAVNRLNDIPGIEIVGFLPEIDQAYANAEVVVAPIFSGSGTKTKILEAMSYGIPVVTTSEGVAGLAVERGRHLFASNSEEDLIGYTRRIFDDPVEADRMSENALTWVRESHIWYPIGQEFSSKLLGLHEDLR